LEQALSRARDSGDRWVLGLCLHLRGAPELVRGAYEQAFAYDGEALAIARELQDHWQTARVLGSIGHMALMQRDFGSAARHYQEALRLYQEISDDQGVVICLIGNACTSILSSMEPSEHERAVRLIGWAQAMRDSRNWKLSPIQNRLQEAAVQQAQIRLDDEAVYHQRLEEGYRMSKEHALRIGLSDA
jgi:hypothetical protein